MPGLFRRLRRRKHEAEPEPARPQGLGEPPAAPADADDAELDSLRGELVRELDRMAAGDDDGSAAFRRC